MAMFNWSPVIKYIIVQNAALNLSLKSADRLAARFHNVLDEKLSRLVGTPRTLNKIKIKIKLKLKLK